MSFFDPESLMFSIDWAAIEEGFKERARKAGYTGARLYAYSEMYSVLEVIDSDITKAASEMAYAAGKNISEIIENAAN